MMTIKIYVGNVPSSARNSELRELFEKFGKVSECDILKEFGFVHMEDSNDAKAAIAGLNDTLWKGSRIRVELSTTKTSKGEPSSRRPARGGGNGGGPIRRRSDEGRIGNRRKERDDDRNGRDDRRRSGGGVGRPPFRGDGPYNQDDRMPPFNGKVRGPPQNGGGGPMRGGDRGYPGPMNGGGRMPPDHRGRPYPDAFDHRGGNRGNMRNGSSHDFGGMPPGPPMPPQFRGGPMGPGGMDMYGDHRGGPGGFPGGYGGPGFGGPDPYMRPPHMLPPPQHHGGPLPMHNDFFRGPPLPPGPPSGPPGSQRYNFDNPNQNFGPPGRVGGGGGGRFNNY